MINGKDLELLVYEYEKILTDEVKELEGILNYKIASLLREQAPSKEQAEKKIRSIKLNAIKLYFLSKNLYKSSSTIERDSVLIQEFIMSMMSKMDKG